MSTNFQGRLAVVTGASSGIGLAVCDLLLQRGARVLAFSRRLGALEALQALHPEQLHWCAGDVTDIDALHAAGVPRESVQHVHDLVMATRHTAVPSAQDERLLVDIDLSILGAERARFDEYEQQIRREYAYVPGFLFRRKRREILQGFLDRPAIYSTPYFHDALEARARAAYSLADLGLS